MTPAENGPTAALIVSPSKYAEKSLTAVERTVKPQATPGGRYSACGFAILR
jgi:hypothetical protein